MESEKEEAVQTLQAAPTWSVGGFHLKLGKAGRAGFAGSILQGLLPVTTLPGSICKEGKDYSTLLLIIPVLKGFFGLSRQQFWQEASQALSWQS